MNSTLNFFINFALLLPILVALLYLFVRSLLLGKWTVEPSRWPWQENNFHAPLNSGNARFGGGWHWCLGFRASRPTKRSWSIIVELLFGMLRISWMSHKAIADNAKWKAECEARRSV